MSPKYTSRHNTKETYWWQTSIYLWTSTHRATSTQSHIRRVNSLCWVSVCADGLYDKAALGPTSRQGTVLSLVWETRTTNKVKKNQHKSTKLQIQSSTSMKLISKKQNTCNIQHDITPWNKLMTNLKYALTSDRSIFLVETILNTVLSLGSSFCHTETWVSN